MDTHVRAIEVAIGDRFVFGGITYTVVLVTRMNAGSRVAIQARDEAFEYTYESEGKISIFLDMETPVTIVR